MMSLTAYLLYSNSSSPPGRKRRLRSFLARPKTLLCIGLMAIYYTDPDGAGLRRLGADIKENGGVTRTVGRTLWSILPFSGSGQNKGPIHDGDCTLRTPILSPEPTTPTFSTTFPGTDSLNLISRLTQSLSGYAAAEEYAVPIPDPHRFSVVTHYPHVTGKRLENDSEYTHGFITLRNPLVAIGNYHQHIYESWNSDLMSELTAQGKTTLQDKRATIEEWESWRDEHFVHQIEEWKNFVAYWLDRILVQNRLLLSYEELVDRRKGPNIASRINTYLKTKIEVGGDSTVADDKVGCTWGKVVNRDGVSAQSEVMAQSESRTYTADQTDLALRIMLELRDKYGDEKEFVDILDMYIDEIENDGGSGSGSGIVQEQQEQEQMKGSVVLMPSNVNPGVASEFLNPVPVEVEEHNMHNYNSGVGGAMSEHDRNMMSNDDPGQAPTTEEPIPPYDPEKQNAKAALPYDSISEPISPYDQTPQQHQLDQDVYEEKHDGQEPPAPAMEMEYKTRSLLHAQRRANLATPGAKSPATIERKVQKKSERNNNNNNNNNKRNLKTKKISGPK